ncbi:helix-turn-helix domain-containing protein [Serratia plymuthica]|uniref:helix-turn-helix domain-containing protein n=1 Tax=Serratia plymuthica TaxID=82996 RepID=UPI001604F230|nr:helix-turn-helix transcriptional regulator [Serratia plymuthica]
MSVGKKIRDLREAEGLTRLQFAELTGIPEGTQKYYETGRRESIGSDVIMKITQHPRFEKYTLWLMTGKTSEVAGQISPALSPDGQDSTSNRQSGQKVG